LGSIEASQFFDTLRDNWLLQKGLYSVELGMMHFVFVGASGTTAFTQPMMHPAIQM
jgi:hypothetical protein